MAVNKATEEKRSARRAELRRIMEEERHAREQHATPVSNPGLTPAEALGTDELNDVFSSLGLPSLSIDQQQRGLHRLTLLASIGGWLLSIGVAVVVALLLGGLLPMAGLREVFLTIIAATIALVMRAALGRAANAVVQRALAQWFKRFDAA